jgi:hypothetical protein
LETPRDAGAERREGNDPLVAFRSKNHSDVTEHTDARAQRRLDTATDERHARVVGDAVRPLALPDMSSSNSTDVEIARTTAPLLPINVQRRSRLAQKAFWASPVN